jgi:ABC-type antimicrobial peptide transport system permease subunit
LARQLLIESLLVAMIGTAGGFLFAMWGSRVLVTQLTSVVFEHVWLDLSVDWRLLAFTGSVTVLTALIFGTAPAWRSSRIEPIEALKEQGRTTSGAARASVSSSLVSAQVALSLILLVVAGLFLRTFERLTHASPGFDSDRLLTDVRRSFAQERLIARLSASFGALALLLAAIGLYGVTAYAVSRRRLEIGIRIALGSTPGRVIRLVLARVAWLVALGVAIGATASAWIAQFATPLLFGVSPRDPTTWPSRPQRSRSSPPSPAACPPPAPPAWNPPASCATASTQRR